MAKAPLKVLRNKRQADMISVDARLSKDLRCFSVRLEGGKPISWVDALHMIMQWAHEEIKDLEMAPDEKSH